MILLDSDVLIDLLRKHSPAMAWFDALQDDGRRGRRRHCGQRLWLVQCGMGNPKRQRIG
jgi:hypothetical protein